MTSRQLQLLALVRRRDNNWKRKKWKEKTDKIIIKLYISENLVKKQSFWNKNEQDRTINNEVTTKKNFDEQNFLILY